RPAQHLIGLQRSRAQFSRADEIERLVGCVERPETGDRKVSLYPIGAFAQQRLAGGIVRGNEGETFGAAKRQNALAGDTGIGVGIGLRGADVREGGPCTDGDGACALLDMQGIPDTGRATADGNDERDQRQQGFLEHLSARSIFWELVSRGKGFWQVAGTVTAPKPSPDPARGAGPERTGTAG